MQKRASLMIMWRIWYARNEVTHYKPPIRIEASRRFLSSYITSLLAIRQHPEADLTKGKQVIDYLGSSTSKHTHETAATPQWKAPDVNFAKLNIDGAFLKEDGTAGTGMILRDHEEAVIFAATWAGAL